MNDLKLVVAGAGGRMGAAVIRSIAAHARTTLHAALVRPGSALAGEDAGPRAGLAPLGLAMGTDIAAALAEADGIIDFTNPETSVTLAQEAAERGLIHVIGTTGCGVAEDTAIAAAAAGARIVKSGNMSLGVNLLAALVRKAAAALDQEFDIEILEMHHRHKVDAPSGTALLLGAAAAEGRNIALEGHSVRGRDGHTGPRPSGSIGFATLRGGTVVGEHSVLFAGPSERLVLSHIAEDRAIFANGAVFAALWARDKPPGLYSMADVLGLIE